MNTTIVGPDGQKRCSWCGAAPEFLNYHDQDCVIRPRVEQARKNFAIPG